MKRDNDFLFVDRWIFRLNFHSSLIFQLAIEMKIFEKWEKKIYHSPDSVEHFLNKSNIAPIVDEEKAEEWNSMKINQKYFSSGSKGWIFIHVYIPQSQSFTAQQLTASQWKDTLHWKWARRLEVYSLPRILFCRDSCRLRGSFGEICDAVWQLGNEFSRERDKYKCIFSSKNTVYPLGIVELAINSAVDSMIRWYGFQCNAMAMRALHSFLAHTKSELIKRPYILRNHPFVFHGSKVSKTSKYFE